MFTELKCGAKKAHQIFLLYAHEIYIFMEMSKSTFTKDDFSELENLVKRISVIVSHSLQKVYTEWRSYIFLWQTHLYLPL